MNLEFQIARRILFGSNSNTVAKPIVRIALLSVALGLSVMLISVMIVTGFKSEITRKVAGFGSHIQVGNFSSNETYENEPLDKDSIAFYHLQKNPYVKHIQAFATKPGIIKTKSDIQGIVLKGIGSDFNSEFFKDKLIAGKFIDVKDSVKTDEILISRKIADALDFKVGSKVHVYFIQQPPRIRVFRVSGIYDTGLEEFDRIFIYCDLAHIQKLNDWNSNQVGGFEIETQNIDNIDAATQSIYNSLGYRYTARNLKENYPQIFNWLALVDSNVVIIIWLMIVVVLINMISTLLIIILDNTSDIGVLKALGAGNGFVRRVFFYVSIYLIAGGLLLGNAFAFVLGGMQHYLHLIKLNQDTYYIDYVPVDFSINGILIVNGLTVVICIAVLFLPSMIVSQIKPVKAIKFE